jgi:hypothetical protein
VSGERLRDGSHNKLFRELAEANSTLLCGFNVEDYFPALVKPGVVKRMLCAKARQVNRRWDELLDKLIDAHASAPPSERGEESDFIDVLLSVQQEYNLTRDHIKAQLVVITTLSVSNYLSLSTFDHNIIFICGSARSVLLKKITT